MQRICVFHRLFFSFFGIHKFLEQLEIIGEIKLFIECILLKTCKTIRYIVIFIHSSV